MDPEPKSASYPTLDELPLAFLRAAQVAMIDEALAAVGDFGEVHLIVQNGRLRFVVTQQSCDALKWQPGSLLLAQATRRR